MFFNFSFINDCPPNESSLFRVRKIEKEKMGKTWILGQSYLSLCLIFLVYAYVCDSQEQAFNTYTISSFSYAKTLLKPYDWRYIRGKNLTPLMYLFLVR